MTIGDATDPHENLLRPTAQLLYTICTLRSAWMCFVEQLLLDTVASSVLAGIARHIAKRSTNKKQPITKLSRRRCHKTFAVPAPRRCRNAKVEIAAISNSADSEYSGVVIPKSIPQLLAAIDKALANIRTNGTYTQISQKYSGKKECIEVISRSAPG
ncbi:transporter substrate-binding domain-containing protein [uncultured Caballeronia sp.]|uniref:transporter substrate-binding domain-containing protein n=1 Tax=uncultured Caballeronia sp. TaxID=1827198 RepID=UPI0035CA295C